MIARRALSSFIALLVLALPAAAQKPRPAPGPQPPAPVSASGLLRDGVVLDGGRGVLYGMRPGGGVFAVRLSDGAPLWESDEGARPLALDGSTLVVEREGAGEASTLELALLDVTDRGRLVGTVEAPLGAPLRTRVDDALGASFRVQAGAAAGRATVLWRAEERTVRGAVLEEEAGAGAQPVTQTVGGAAVDLATRTVSPLDVAVYPEARPLREPAEGLRLPVEGAQYLSADDRHIATSERVGRDPEWNQYRWTVREALSGTVVGTFDHPVSIAPFVVAGTTLVLETRPYQRRVADGSYVQQPLALRGIDLASGRELWMRELRDVTYYGPYPP
ncbi:MAG: hypothetical protein R2991_11795 [Thermoanaerobaculia bacterium]